VKVEQREPRVNLCTRKVEQTQLALGIHTCSRHDDRPFRAAPAQHHPRREHEFAIIQVIREEHGLAYSIYSTPSFTTTPATL